MDNSDFEDDVKPLVNLAKRRVTTRPKSRLPEHRRTLQFSEPQKLDALSLDTPPYLDVDFFFNDVKSVDWNKQAGKLSSTVDLPKCEMSVLVAANPLLSQPNLMKFGVCQDLPKVHISK